MRLDKFLRESSVGTGRTVTDYIKSGLVAVNGQAVLNPSLEIDAKNDRIELSGNRILYSGKKYYMFNKPAGCITAKSDAVHRTVFDYFKEADKNGIFHVGRLDKDTEGLLIFTNDGEFNNRLMKPDSHVMKEYFFIALGNLDEEDVQCLERGVSIGKDEPLTMPAVLEGIRNTKYSALKDELMINLDNAGHTDSYDPDVVSGCIKIAEGRQHQVKRMLKARGCHVIYLKRLSVGNLRLDDSLQPGLYRELTDNEIGLAAGEIIQ